MNEQDIKNYVALFSYTILDNVVFAISGLSKHLSSHSLSKDDWNTIMQEFLFFNMNVCGRFTVHWFGVETGERIVDKMFAEIGSTIDENREKILNNKLDSLTMQNLSEYFATLRNDMNSKHLKDLYNRRAIEYSEYDLVREDNSKGMAGLLNWEFAEKLATLLKHNNDALFITFFHFTAATLAKRILSAKEVWDKH